MLFYLEETNVAKKFSATCIITIGDEKWGTTCSLVISTTWDPELLHMAWYRVLQNRLAKNGQLIVTVIFIATRKF